MSNRALTWAFAQSTGNPGRKAVLVALADMADEADSCWPSQATLARMTDQSERSVRGHLAALESAGFVHRTRRRDTAGHRSSDRYVLAVSVAVGVANRQDPPVARSAAEPPAESVTPTGKSRQVTLKIPQDKISPSAAAPRRDDVEKLCHMLADRIEANGSKRPAITGRWRDACRLMIDRDHREPEKIAKAIEWCQSDEFWRANILSMPKLRDKYDQLRLAAQRQASRPAAAVRDFEAEREAARLERQRARFASSDRLAGAR